MKTHTQPPRTKRHIVELDPSRPIDDDQYPTTDLNLAAFLGSTGHYLADVRSDGRQTTFVFDDRQACLAASALYHNEADDMVQASVLLAELRKLKQLAIRGGF